MSFSFRDKQRLSDRLRGRTGDEILNDFKEQLDQDRKKFFETSPTWGSKLTSGSFSRMPAGFPFDDDMMPRRNIRSHLDDLAQRHPEFADHLRCPPWGGEMHGGGGGWPRKRRGSGSCGEDEVRSQSSGGSDVNPQATDFEQQEQVEEPGPLRGRPRQNNLPQYGLRNTVDIGQQQHANEQEDKQDRGQRSWSAPPDNRSQNPGKAQRFVTRVDINPVNPDDPSSSDVAPNQGSPAAEAEVQGKPPVVPKQQASNVRHIPIFVEGRDEPVISKDKAQGTPSSHSFGQGTPSSHSFGQGTPSSHSFGRSSPFAYHQQFQQPPHHVPPSGQTPKVNKPCSQESRQAVPPQQQATSSQQPSPQQPSPQHPSPQQPSPQQPPKKIPIINDPISRVKAVAKDVDGLMAYVEAYSGNSRKDKNYMYLDEMLTRNLLKLDDIETEGKADVRQARKDVIGYIQKCIGALENKVPLEEQPTSVSEKMDEEQVIGKTAPEQMNPVHEDQTTNTLDTKKEAEAIVEGITAESVVPTQSDQNVEVPSSTTTEMDVTEQKLESTSEAESQVEQKIVGELSNETSNAKDTVIAVDEMGPITIDEHTVTSTQQVETVSSQVPDTTMVEGEEDKASSTSCEDVSKKTVLPNQTVAESSQQ